MSFLALVGSVFLILSFPLLKGINLVNCDLQALVESVFLFLSFLPILVGINLVNCDLQALVESVFLFLSFLPILVGINLINCELSGILVESVFLILSFLPLLKRELIVSYHWDSISLIMSFFEDGENLLTTRGPPESPLIYI